MLCNHDTPSTRHLLLPALICLAALCLLTGTVPARAEITFPSIPLNEIKGGPPIFMLVAGRDHKLFHEAYSGITTFSDGRTINAGFNPRIVYYGLFDSKLCYQGTGVNNNGTLYLFSNTDYFEASGAVTDMQLHKCGGGQWSGNFLNYVTTSRMDALRRLLYGGTRLVDTPTETVLRRAYIPRDGHAWGKEYTSTAVDGYNIADYTPFSSPNTGRRHFFGNYGWHANCVICRNGAPVLAVALNAAPATNLGFERIWDWANADIDNGVDNNFNDSYFSVTGSNSKKYSVQVKACSKVFTLPDNTKNYRGENCKPYTNDKGVTVYKPVGILHKFGEDGSILFGLLTGSYDTNVSGGVLRKAVSSFAGEVNPQTGQFTSNATIVQTFNNIVISGFAGENTLQPIFSYRNFRTPSVGSYLSARIMNEGEYPDWGNPIGEMMYEALRYLSGAGKPVSAFSSGSANDNTIGLKRATWDKPYERAHQCSRPNLLVLSDINPSFDSDQLPGARFQSCTTVSGILKTSDSCTKAGGSGTFDPINNSKPLDVGQLLDDIGQKEGINGKDVFIGQSGSQTDWVPSIKRANSLSTIRGLAPEDPGKEGSYTSAAVAYYGKTVGIPTEKGNQTVNTYVVALSSPLPRIEVPTPKGTIIIVPFGKTVEGPNIVSNQENFQPSNQIVKFNSVNINPRDPDNGGRYSATVLVSFDDAEQASDYDMDFRVEYRVLQLENNDVEVTVTPIYFANPSEVIMNVGYVVSGAGTQDGPYLVVQNRSLNTYSRPYVYYLNTPVGKPSGWCANPANIPPNYDPNNLICIKLPACTNGVFGKCDQLGEYSRRVFTPSGNAATLLKNPLWYAAKWGGFRVRPGDTQHWPDTPAKWDADGNGQPDNYFSIRNIPAVEKALVSVLNFIEENQGQSSSLISTSSDIFGSSDTLAFSTTFSISSYPPDWSGNLIATAITQISKDNPSGLGPVRWRAAEKLPAAGARRIFTRANPDLQDISNQGVEFKWEQLNPNQQAALTWDNQFDGASVLDYVRGSAEKEIARGGTFRDRTRAGNAASPLGDSPNNTPVYYKPTNTIYLGANDGMLHVFNAATGQELFAYLPSALIPKLPELALHNYGHAWYVDGETAIGSVREDASSVKHMLVGALGRGGKGLFGLDVTNPASFSARSVAWELNGTPTGQCGGNSDHDNLGHILGTPFIATFNDGKTYALVGNGYNSCTGKAALYIIDIQTGKIVRRIDVTSPVAGDNGLSTPVALDVNGDGKIDLVWAGDLLGNLWRFDLRSSSPKDWGTHTTHPIFIARNNNEIQPITAPPAVTLYKSDNGLVPFVSFGTGRYLTIADKSDQAIQSWYGLIDDSDNNDSTTTPITPTKLTRYKFVPSDPTTRTVQKQDPSNADIKNPGWVIDFDIKGDAGERVINAPVLIKTQRGTVVMIPSIIPSSDPCKAGGRGYINFVNAFTGAVLDSPFIDINGDGIIDKKDIQGSPGSLDLQIGMPGNITIVGNQIIVGGTEKQGDRLFDFGKVGRANWGRVSWREIIRE